MFDGLFKSKFYSKCKSNINLLKKRLEAIRTKRSVMQKHWKNDIAELLRNGHDIEAYGRAERLLVEQNMLACYEFIEKFCGCISNHLSAMNKQRDCPEECKEAVPSLMYAAARFYDLPELRDLRTVFTDRYRNSLESYTNKEFVESLRSNPPTKKIKIQLLQDVAQESNIGWNSKALEQKLYTTAPKQDHPKCGSLSNIDDEKWKKNKDDAVPERDNQNAGNRLSNGKGFITKRKDSDRNFHGRKDVIGDRYRKPSSNKQERTKDSSQDGLKTSSNVDKPKPRSVERRNLKPQERTKHAVDCDPRDEEERKDHQYGEYRRNRKKSHLDVPPDRTAALTPEPTLHEATKKHVRAPSLQPEMLRMAGHVHPKLPEYHELAARIAALQGR
ncbi:hypothetical protein SLA2020_348390 [Shorea laevis]